MSGENSRRPSDTNKDLQAAIDRVSALERALALIPVMLYGSGSPQGVVVGLPGQYYIDTTNNLLYVYNSVVTGTTSWTRAAVPFAALSVTGTSSLPGSVTAGAISNIAMGTVVVDTNGWYNTGTSRYTPLLAGRYLVSGYFHGTATSTGNVLNDLAVASAGAIKGMTRSPASSSFGPELNVVAQCVCNGSTDTIELQGGSSGGSGTAVSGSERMDIIYLGVS